MAASPQAVSQKTSTAPTVKLLIDGKFVESKAKQWRDVVNPATQEVLARVPMCDAAEVGLAVQSAANAFKTWRHVPIGSAPASC
jgi:malonate-semialdehyde dehydrogenase (acetylating)/methylmalonate-semialdehyde dehydrogenase